MATLLTVQDSINFVVPFLKNQPVQVSNQQPAIMAANIVLGSMLGPPMVWRFNRKEINFPISNGGGTDYAQLVTDLGFIESGWAIDASNVQYPVAGSLILGKNLAVGRPEKIAPQFDDNAGNITFRIDKVPDVAYTMYVDYQKKAQLLSSVASSWGPMPDEFNYIYNYGLLAVLSLLVNDSRFPIFEKYFIGRLLNTQDGLTDQAKAIFLGNWANAMATLKRSEGAVAGGVAGRGI